MIGAKRMVYSEGSFFIFFMLLLNELPNIENNPTQTCFSRQSKKLRARHMSCFLRPDTGPCRADIIQWYFDVKLSKCFQFFWGGCQGNGNRFETKADCDGYCKMNSTQQNYRLPHFCKLPFDYGTCFGHYYRYFWDDYYKVCKRRLYSGCGGNQNNFETISECRANCITPPNNTLDSTSRFTKCYDVDVNEERRK